MKRYAVFTARFGLVTIISGPFVVSMTGRASGLEWAHIITGYATIYLIIGMLLIPAKQPGVRFPASMALVAGAAPLLATSVELAIQYRRSVFVSLQRVA